MSKRKYKNPGGPVHNLSKQERVAIIEKNGITIKELERSYNDGYTAGHADALGYAYDAAFGAIMLALHEEFGFGRDRLTRVCNKAAEMQIEYFTNEEQWAAVIEKTGLTLPHMRELIQTGGIPE